MQSTETQELCTVRLQGTKLTQGDLVRVVKANHTSRLIQGMEYRFGGRIRRGIYSFYDFYNRAMGVTPQRLRDWDIEFEVVS